MSLRADLELEALMQRAKDAVAAMFPEERAAMWREQRISWVRGQIGLMHGREMPSYEEIAALVDAHDAKGDAT